jgi:hypothetical protein
MKIFITYRFGLTVYRLPRIVRLGGRIIETIPQARDYPFRYTDFKSQLTLNMMRGGSTGLLEFSTKDISRPIDSVEIINGRAKIVFVEKITGEKSEFILNYQNPMLIAIPVNHYYYSIEALESKTITQIKRNYRRYISSSAVFE